MQKNNYEKMLGIGLNLNDPEYRKNLIKYINLKLSAMDLPIYEKGDTFVLKLANDLLENIREKNRILHDYYCPVDKRIQDFIENYLSDIPKDEIAKLPNSTLVLDRYGISRELSLPPDDDKFISDGVESYRVKQGVLHNPKNDRRTTKGVFHVVEGGLPVPFDKKEVPKITFARLYKAALNAPENQLELPFTATQDEKARTFVSLHIKPMVCPEVKGYIAKKDMEIRVFTPGNYVCNLDFIESIFGNAGDPFLASNDAGLDPEHWTGYTGCIILAPHICGLNKKDLGLPHISEATERQKRDGMCWESEDELYNDGQPFKICVRDRNGVIITLIADNYFGYCKKEVKTQIGYAANLYGLVEEEHAGGALATPRRNFGRQFIPDSTVYSYNNTFDDTIKSLGDNITVYPEGYAIDNNYSDIYYISENATFDVDTQTVSWEKDGKKQTLKLLAEHTFVYPTGLKINLEKNPAANSWRLVGTYSEGTMCHKPCTVSGGGKSEISKSILDAMFYGPIFTADFEKDMIAVEEIINKDYSGRFKNSERNNHKSRSILSSTRSLGSVIKLLNPSPENTDEFNEWLESVPNRIKGILFLVKRHYKEEWGNNWREHFGVDFINGELGHEMKFRDRKMVGSYLRVGRSPEGIWRTCKLRMDYIPSVKVQWEDDISASIIVPSDKLNNLNPDYSGSKSVKIAENCEFRFFQRPDDAVIRGYDKQAEADLASEGNFISNFAPLTKNDAIEIMEKSISYHEYTDPIKDLIKGVAKTEKDDELFVCSSMPRIVNGAPTKNPRYLQTRPDLLDGKDKYMSLTSMRLFRKIEAGLPLHTPVNAVLPGRRNNPADHEAKIRPLAVYGPIHYQELPELFADFICSLTGKSPSTTGAGSEGALTKGPFNALCATSDLNNALLSFILTGYNGFSTAAGYIGHKYKVDHDISLLIPELWSLMTEEERSAEMMIEKGYLEKIEDFEHNGEYIIGSRLGYRITDSFVNQYLGKVFENPNSVFEEDMLKPELQNLDDFADGIKNICEAQQKVAKAYIEDGSVEGFIPPLKALIYIMATGEYEGKDINSSEIRNLFTRESVVNSDWYKERLKIKQSRKVDCNKMHINYLEEFVKHEHNQYEVERMSINEKLNKIHEHLKWVESEKYLENINGTLGADPIYE
jgi:hypothetical protein